MKSYSFMVAFILLALTACGQADASEVDKERTQLSSSVAEASFLAQGVADGRFTGPFVKVEADDLSQDAANTESALPDAQVAGPAKAKASKVRQAARLLAGAMDSLEAAPGDREGAARVVGQLKQAKAALESA